MVKKRRSRTERQREIAEISLKILGLYGNQNFKTSLLAKELGLSEAALFKHFKSKEEIIDAAIDYFNSILENSFPPEDLEPLERLRRFVIKRIQILQNHPEFREIAFNNQLFQIATPAGQKKLRAIFKKSIDFVRNSLKEASVKGEIHPHIPVEIMLWTVIGVIQGASKPNYVKLAYPPESTSTSDYKPPNSPDKIWKYLRELLKCCKTQNKEGKK